MNVLGILFMLLLGIHVVATLLMERARRGGKAPATITTLIVDVAPFIVLCCSGRKTARRRTILGAYLQTALLFMACYFGYLQGVFSRQLISPIYILLGLLAGHLIFGISLLITQQSLRTAASHFVDFHALWTFMIESPAVLMQFISVSIAEELIYRVGMQPLLIAWTGSAAVSIAIVAVVFSFVHEHFLKNEVMQSSEFLGFAILLGVLYYWTGSLILVIVIHAVRNIEIAFLEYLVRLDETGSEEIAARESEFLAGERLAVYVVAPACGLDIAYLEYIGWNESRACGSPPGVVSSASNSPCRLECP